MGGEGGFCHLLSTWKRGEGMSVKCPRLSTALGGGGQNLVHVVVEYPLTGTYQNLRSPYLIGEVLSRDRHRFLIELVMKLCKHFFTK